MEDGPRELNDVTAHVRATGQPPCLCSRALSDGYAGTAQAGVHWQQAMQGTRGAGPERPYAAEGLRALNRHGATGSGAMLGCASHCAGARSAAPNGRIGLHGRCKDWSETSGAGMAWES